MRWDFALYIVGTLFLGTSIYMLLNRASVEPVVGGLLIYGAVALVLILFGITSFIFGYSLRPRGAKPHELSTR
jgi:multisubunit Na+/H+ antiporter MnhC subunit